MEDKRIKAVKNWPEPKSVQDIQVFLGFANFYRRFIYGFSKITTSLTLMLKIMRSSKVLAPIFIEVNNNTVPREDSLKPYLSKSKKTKITKSKNLIKGPTILFNVLTTELLTFKAKVAFI